MNKTQVFVASLNPVKVQTVKNGFQKMFPHEEFLVSGLATPSNVSPQPMTDSETFLGASNRTSTLQIYTPTANYWVGIEGGVQLVGAELEAFAWVVIKSQNGLVGKGRTASFFLPQGVAKLVLSGEELGNADDHFFGRNNSKQSNGSVGILTRDVINRIAFYEQAVILALIPFVNPDLF